MATAYRDYLVDNGELKTSLDTSYDTRVDFLGTDRESWLMGTRGVTMTTADNIVDIYDDLEKSGVTRAGRTAVSTIFLSQSMMLILKSAVREMLKRLFQMLRAEVFLFTFMMML